VAKLLVIGASRGIGLETVKAALRAGQSVRALPRSAASIPIQDAGRATVARIMANHSRVVVLKIAFADGPVCSWPIAISASCSQSGDACHDLGNFGVIKQRPTAHAVQGQQQIKIEGDAR
jgi:NAD(P)-dependent dehydrogenase (short-subunit alcohol dehydrogenase family)